MIVNRIDIKDSKHFIYVTNCVTFINHYICCR